MRVDHGQYYIVIAMGDARDWCFTGISPNFDVVCYPCPMCGGETIKKTFYEDREKGCDGCLLEPNSLLICSRCNQNVRIGKKGYVNRLMKLAGLTPHNDQQGLMEALNRVH